MAIVKSGTLALLLVVWMSWNVSSTSDKGHFVYIDGKDGFDNETCLISNSSEHMCKSLEFVANNLQQLKNSPLVIEVHSPHLNMTSHVKFFQFTDLTLTPANTSTGIVINCSMPDAGLYFACIQNLTISSVTLQHCGVQHDSYDAESNTALFLNSALYILNCIHLNIRYVVLTHSNGTGLSVHNTNGVVTIENCALHTNSMKHPLTAGGGGLNIKFTSCTPCNCTQCESVGRDATYTIRNTTFAHNYAGDKMNETVKYYTPHSVVPSSGQGGGMYIKIGSNTSNNVIHIVQCVFQHNHAAYWGGGLYIGYFDSSSYNTVIIKDTMFRSNSARLWGGGLNAEWLNSPKNNSVALHNSAFRDNECTLYGGGGIAIGLMLYKQSDVKQMVPDYNSFLCQRCKFHHNYAKMGGGLAVFSTKQHEAQNNTVRFVKSVWTNNHSPTGAAVYISPGIWDYTKQGVLSDISFSNCTFSMNKASHRSVKLSNSTRKRISGFGTVFISQCKVTFEQNIVFVNNSGSAVYLSGSVLEFSQHSEVEFTMNSGINGGAIAMYAFSNLHIHNDSTFCFVSNTASLSGGAIFSQTLIPQLSYQNCLIQPNSPEHPLTNTEFHFIKNSAQNANSNSIYATSFHPCKKYCSDTHVSSPQDILACIGDFHFDDGNNSNSSLIATFPVNFNVSQNLPFEVIPGSEYSLAINVTDEASNKVSDVVYRASIRSKGGGVMVDPAYGQVSHNKINVLGTTNYSASLMLEVYDVTLILDIMLVSCPPGYSHNNQSGRCECAATEYFGIARCDPNALLINGFWMGYCDESDITKLCTAYCPYGFCSYNTTKRSSSYTHTLPNSSAELDQFICGPTRTGRVCGKCAPNHSVHFHSWKYKCGEDNLCHLGWLFYILSEVFPLTLCFIAIIIFNISFTHGNISCFVLFAQILDSLSTDANGAIEFPQFVVMIRHVQHFVYRFFNLDFFSLESLSFCLWKSATVMDALVMKYVTVGVALGLVLLTILISRGKCGKLCYFLKMYKPRSVLIHGFSAFFMLCYSQCARVSFQILNKFCLFSQGLSCEKSVVYRSGHMDYLGAEHLKYATTAIIFLTVLVIIPPLLLLLYPLSFKALGICKLSESKIATVLWRVMPIQLLDSFQSSFKDNLRFFAGLYFLYRAIALAAYAYCRTLLQFYTVVELQLILILALHAIFQPYKERKHNIIDSLLLTNLTVINSITLYNFSEAVYGKGEQRFMKKTVIITSTIQTVLIFLPLMCVIVLATEKLITRYKKWRLERVSAGDNDDDLPSLRDPNERHPTERDRLMPSTHA